MTRRLRIFALQALIIFFATALLQQLSAHGFILAAWHMTGDQLFISLFAACLLGLVAQSNWGQRIFRRRSI